MDGMSKARVVGRDSEKERFLRHLHEADRGAGSTLVLEGPTGVGKTHLAQWVADEAKRAGFTVLAGHPETYGGDPLRVWEELLHASGARAGDSPSSALPATLPVADRLVLVETDRIAEVLPQFATGESSSPRLIVSRERAPTLVANHPELGDRGIDFLTLSRGEGPDRIPPTDVDGMGVRISDYLHAHPRARVLVSEFQYLVTQNSFLPVFRLIEYLREEADSTGGTIVLGMNPATLEPREVALVRAEADSIVDEKGGTQAVPTPVAPEPRLLRILDRLVERSEFEALFLWLEHLENSDPLFLRCFDLLCRNVPGHRIFLLGTLTVPTGSSNGSRSRMETLIASLEGSHLIGRVSLGPLGDVDSVEMLKDHLGTVSTSTPADMQRLVSAAQGNPLALRSLAHAELLGSNSGHSGEEHPKSGDPAEAGLSQLVTALPPTEREMLEWAALIGNGGSAADFAALTGLAPAEVEGVLSNLERSSLLHREGPAETARWTTSSRTLTDVLLRSLSVHSLRERAGKAATLLSQGPSVPSLDVARLFFSADDLARGEEWARRALEDARKYRSVNAAVGAFELLWDHATAEKEARMALAATASGLALSLVQWGGVHEAVRLLRHLLESPSDTETQWKIRAALAATLITGSRPEAKDEALRVREEVEHSGRSDLLDVWSQASHTLVRAAMFDGEYGQVVLRCEEVLDRLRQSGDPAFEKREESLLYWESWALLQLGRLEDAWSKFREALALALRLQDADMEADCLNLEGELFSAQGDYSQAERAYAESVILDRRRGFLADLAIDLCNLAGVQARIGKQKESRENAEKALQLASRFHTPRPKALALCHLGRLALMEGDLPRARRHTEDADREAQSIGIPWLSASIGLVLAETAIEEGNSALSQTLLLQLEGAYPRMKAEDQIQFHRLTARSATLSGQQEAARSLLEEALALARKRKNSYFEDILRRELAAVPPPEKED